MDLGIHNAEYLEELYQVFIRTPEQLEPEMRRFFTELEHQEVPATKQTTKHSQNNAKVEAMINTFRRRGHLKANLNPLTNADSIVPYRLEDFALQAVNPQQLLYPTNLSGVYGATAKEIIEILQRSYCGSIGVDYVEINNEERVQWISKKLEQCSGRMTFTIEERKRILWDLLAAEGLEKFLHNRYLGQKRFSLEGCDTLIPMLDFMLSTAAAQGVQDICVGMAHRGRLNVLANIMHKDLASLFAEFEDTNNIDSSFDIDGDVKYHIGFSTTVKKAGHDLGIALLPNPSHLEAINPVLEGYVRAKQRQLNDEQGTKVLPLLIHGDASFSGQGVVYETLNLSKLPHYSTGGTVHIVIDNQIGFTTNPDCARSTEYCSDIVKAIRAPVFHVNADDPEATALSAVLAFSYRQKFNSDVVIHLVGYRRYGHNEGDEPAFTQPLMYKKIKAHARVATQYIEQLQDHIPVDEINALRSKYRQMLDDAYKRVKNISMPTSSVGMRKQARVQTAVKGADLKALAKKITSVPDGFTLHPKIAKLFQQRRSMCDSKIDWGMAELLALAALANAGKHLRLSGQDVQRGTFSSRHAVVWDLENGNGYQVFSKFAANVDIINSPLSEFGALGFEFGYSVVDPQALVLWEAQFGDFSNGAQVIIDQFLSASAAKWAMHSNLVLLLPHGYEGMGPEHSNARPERFLQLCGNDNMQVAIPTTAAQYFHLLRHQALTSKRMPLIVMSPKSMLRHPQVASPVQEFTQGKFAPVIDDDTVDADAVKRIVFCAGKIYYELLAARGEKKDIAIIRFEYLYPFPHKVFTDIISKYTQVTKIIWAQEEPQNMGSWDYIHAKIGAAVKARLHYVGRKVSGTTAEGSLQAHRNTQGRIVSTALGTKQR